MILLMGPRLGFQGGVESHIHDLAVGLRRRGHRVGYAHAHARGREEERFARAFDEVAPLDRAGHLLREARVVYAHKVGETALQRVPATTRLVVMIHDHDATCVRRHRYLPVSNTPCHRAPGVACVAHGCVVVRDRERLVGLSLRDPFALARSTRRMARRSVLVVGSRYMKRTLVDAGVEPGRVVVIHPVPPEWSAPVVEAPKEPVIAFFGQVIRGKGLDLLVRAIAELSSFRLEVAGTGDGLPQIRRLVERLGLDSRVTFLGALPPDELMATYDKARVVAVPSRWPEPFGMVGIEAMRRARVVVAAKHGGICEWLEDGMTGVGFVPGDVDSLRSALQRAALGAGYEVMARAAHERAQREFGFEGMVDGIEREVLIS